MDPRLWMLERGTVFLNHGSFGACPRVVLALQQELRNRLERQPVRFFVRDFEALWDAARAELSYFLGAHADDLVFVTNATAGVNTALAAFPLRRGDEVLVTDHEYNACRNALDTVARRCHARVVVAPVPFPLRSPGEIEAALLERITPRTRLALLDHVTSPTGLVLPVETLVPALRRHGVETLVDGAHAPGMVALHLNRLGAAFYTGNCHKWLCAPKGAAFLHVRRDLQSRVHPLVISHGANSPRSDRSRFLLEFGWMGTADPTPWLCVPRALRFLSEALPEGWDAIRQRNRQLALAAREILCRALKLKPPCPASLIGSLVAVPLPDAPSVEPPTSPLYLDPLQDRLWAEARIEVPIIPWPAPPRRILRISAQLYNALPQYRLLAEQLVDALRHQGSVPPVPRRSPGEAA